MNEVERIARALCEADGAGPDDRFETGEWTTIIKGDETATHLSEKPVMALNWTKHEKEARRFIAAFRALAPAVALSSDIARLPNEGPEPDQLTAEDDH